MVPQNILDQVHCKSVEGLALALASDDDGAVMVFHWCNKAFCNITGYGQAQVLGERGTILIGSDTEQDTHLLIIEKLMKWECFSVTVTSNRRDGSRYCAKMTWTPLSDMVSGDRWWLCSLVDLDTYDTPDVVTLPPRASLNNSDLAEKFSGEIVRLEKENKRLLELATVVARESNEDPLTGLSNRRHFELELKTWVDGLRKDGPDFAVLYIDLDRFKSVNDTLGHGAGDQLLITVAKLLRRLSSSSDLVARLGGDEFVVLKPLAESALDISGLADRIVEELRKPFTFEGKSVACSASVGVAIANARMDRPEEVVADADTALYHAKENGRARWSFFTAEMHAESIATKQLATELLIACEHQAFTPYFHPLVDAETGRIASAEVLVRWPHPKRGLLPPVAFLDVAESMGIVSRIDEIVFARLRNALKLFDERGALLPKVAVNVSAGRLADPTFVHDIKSSGIDPERLTVEILESVYLERLGDVMRWALDELDELGVTIAIDDFGTGHASVQGLLKIKPDVLKIDRQFMKTFDESSTSQDLLKSIIGIGKSLGTKIVAEGVETERHAQFAKDLGCDFLQGFHFGKPMSAEDLSNKLQQTQGVLWRTGNDRAAI